MIKYFYVKSWFQNEMKWYISYAFQGVIEGFKTFKSIFLGGPQTLGLMAHSIYLWWAIMAPSIFSWVNSRGISEIWIKNLIIDNWDRPKDSLSRLRHNIIPYWWADMGRGWLYWRFWWTSLCALPPPSLKSEEFKNKYCMRSFISINWIYLECHVCLNQLVWITR